MNDSTPRDTESASEGDNEILSGDSLQEQDTREHGISGIENYDTASDFDSGGTELDIGGFLNIELLNINFQKMSLNDPVNSVEELRLSEWQQLLCKFSTDILYREQKVASKEATLSLMESRSMVLVCKVCMENDCNIVTLPCMHISMCNTCSDLHTADTSVLHSCPMCRANIRSSSHVYFA